MAYKYLLTNGESTDRIEEYIMDLFRLYLSIYPGDIPHYKDLGIDFIFTDVTKDNLESGVRTKVNSLLSKIREAIPSKYQVSINTLDLIDEETVKLVIDVNGELSEDIYINLYE